MADPEVATKAPESDAQEDQQLGSISTEGSVFPNDSLTQSGPSMGEHCTTDRPIPTDQNPSGSFTQYSGIDVYVSKPSDYPHAPSRLLLLLTGGTGVHSINNQLQADKYATEGYVVVMPDQFSGDPAPTSTTDPNAVTPHTPTLIERLKLGIAETAKSFMIDMWLARHTKEKVLPILHTVLETAKDEFADAVANGGGVYAAGYCFGAKYVLSLAGESADDEAWGQSKAEDEEEGMVKTGPAIKAGAIAHATLVEKSDLTAVKAPVTIVAVENDPLFPSEILEAGREYFESNNVKHEIKVFPEVPHGFAVLINPKPRLEIYDTITMHRALSIRSKDRHDKKDASKHTFSVATLRGLNQAELSKKLYKLVKTENHVISAYEAASRERLSVASQLSDWGESTNDDSISDVSDKIGVILSELGEQEDLYAQNLEDYRTILKQIRNTESSVQPSRDHKAKTQDEIQKLKYKEPTSPKLVQLEQELVRAEAQNLVAEAQLTNITRQKLKEAYDIHFAATIERAEKQLILAKHGRRIVNLLDDNPVVPGDARPAFEHAAEARDILNDAESDLQAWSPNFEPIHSSASGLGNNLMPSEGSQPASAVEPSVAGESVQGEKNVSQGEHLAEATGSSEEAPQATATAA